MCHPPTPRGGANHKRWCDLVRRTKERSMPTPYNLTIEEHCTTCALRAQRQFCNMSPEPLAALESMKFTAVYPKGSTLFVEGEQPRGVFILCKGRVKLTTSSSEGRTLIV